MNSGRHAIALGSESYRRPSTLGWNSCVDPTATALSGSFPIISKGTVYTIYAFTGEKSYEALQPAGRLAALPLPGYSISAPMPNEAGHSTSLEECQLWDTPAHSTFKMDLGGYPGTIKEPNYCDLSVDQWPVRQGKMVVVKSRGAGPKAENSVAVSDELLPSWIGPTIARFIKVKSLNANWDSYGASPISTDVLNQALVILRSIMKSEYPSPSVVPVSDGGVQIEWHHKKQDLEIAFSPDSPAEFYYRDREAGFDQEGSPADLEVLRDLLEKIA